MQNITDYIYDWNQNNKHYHSIEIEDDTLRDGLQGAFLKKPTLDEKLALLELSSEMGVQNVMLGFPAASETEYRDCLSLIRALDEKEIPLNLYFLGRAKISDLESIVSLSRKTFRHICADFFIGMSPIRCLVEEWSFNDLLNKCNDAAHFLNEQGVAFSISLEDVTRSTPDDIDQIMELAIEKKAERITLCDTVGSLLPTGTTKIITYIKQNLLGASHKPKLGWHGHNDNGLALANAIAAMDAGIDFISGSFAGIGERSGNVALEQVIFYLYQHGNKHYKPNKIIDYCRQLSTYVEYSIPSNAPLIGSQVFATSTGTHTNAIMKARKFGIDFEDYIFSSIPASQLGREQEIYINYNSGISNVTDVLNKLGIEVNQYNLDKVLGHAKKERTNLANDTIRNIIKENVQ